MWLFRSIILALAIALSNTLPLDSVSPLPELENGGVHWAFLVAGSKGWNNYRHQADICHAYQILHRNGIPDERIVVMMYDDIAFNKENPYPGIIMNHFHGPDVYNGVPKDYTGNAVNATVFLKVLQGDSKGLSQIGSGKVIKSGPYDHIFLFFADHGAPGLVAFPDSYLYESQFVNTLIQMYTDRKYAKMLIYIQASKSGSMFRDLPIDVNIFGVSATNGNEQSHACYFDSELGTYLGDVFSVTWMEHSDKVNLSKVTIQQQYDVVRKEVNTSHVQKFGDMSIGKMNLSSFQGSEFALQTPGDNYSIPFPPVPPFLPFPPFPPFLPFPVVHYPDPVPSNEVTLMILMYKLENAKTDRERKIIIEKLAEYFKKRESLRQIFHHIIETVTQDNEFFEILPPSDEIRYPECYEEAVEHFRNACSYYIQSEFVFELLETFVHLCNAKFYIGHITAAIDVACIPPVYEPS